MLNRRHLVASLSLLPFAGPGPAFAGDNPEGLIAAIEKRAGGRIGVAALDTRNGHRIAWRADERFPMCSTFKVLAVGALLAKVDRGQEKLDRFVPYDSLPNFYAPVTRAHLAKHGMKLADLAAAAIEWSDNGAANLILADLGGPLSVTHFVRGLGDNVTRLDRIEPELNSSIPGDPRDTTSPSAMLESFRKLVTGKVLSPASRALLTGWLKDCQTAKHRIPAGLPAGWTSGDKTGTGSNGSANDVAIIWPPNRPPIFLSVYTTGAKASDAAHDAVIADIAKTVTATI
jgi:beta-lactamase class A